MTGKTWFITGASRGFGRHWTTAALRRGDRVAATARDVAALDGLVAEYGDVVVPLRLDVTDRAAVFSAVQRANTELGRLDVVVNNAGYGQFGMAEEVSEDDVRAQFETNVFGAIWVSQAAAPILREQGSGHLVQVSSIGGVSAFAGLSIYNASKWALEGFSQALADELSGFGVHVTLVEPGGFATDWGGASARRAPENPAYDGVRERRARQRARQAGSGLGDPAASAAALLRVVDADKPPLRVFFGSTAFDVVRADYESRLATWREWDDIARLAQGGEE